MINYITSLLKKNFVQFFLLIFVLIQNKILIEYYTLELYGEYILQVSYFTVLNSLSFPGLYHYLRKISIERYDKGILTYLRFSPLILAFGISIIFILYLTNLIEYFHLYLFGFIAYFFGSYDYVLLGRSKVNLSRILILFQAIIFTVIVLLYSSYLDVELLLYIHLILYLVRSIVGWIIVILNSDFKKANPEKIKSYLIQKNFSEIFNPLISKLDNLILGNISTSELGLYNVYKLVPNTLKSNLKLFLIDFNNKLIASKNNYYNHLSRYKSSIYLFSIITVIISSILSMFYFGFISNWDYDEMNIVIIILLSLSTIFKVLNDIFWNYNIYVQDGKLQMYVNIISKVTFVFLLLISTHSIGLFGIIMSYIIYDIINLIFSFNNLSSNEKI